MSADAPVALPLADARAIFIRAQRLDRAGETGGGAAAVADMVRHLGYVQIDTINVVERCHHHILWSRLPGYRRGDLEAAQSEDRSLFEYWTHALSYIPVEAYANYLPAMRRYGEEPGRWFGTVNPKDLRRMLRRIRDDGPISIRDVTDDELVDKDHPWASRKPSKRALEFLFFTGELVVSRRHGIVKTYELAERHFGWVKKPRPANEKQIANYLLDRALTSQGIVSLDSICHLDAPSKPAIRAEIEARIRRRQLRPVAIATAQKGEHWVAVEALDALPQVSPTAVHLLSPFDPLVIQRKRLSQFFHYEHRFEAYVPKEKRVLGYFALPVLAGDEIVAAIDTKADRPTRSLLIQKWTWVGTGSDERHRTAVEEALHRFSLFQFPDVQDTLD